MLKKILIAVVAVLAIVLIYAATKPDSFRVQRAGSIKASPEKISALITDFHRWGAWSPWEKLDPAMKRTFSGSESGVGSVYAWEGNSDAGKGRMEILESSTSKIAIKLDFQEPFASQNHVEFALEPNGEATNVAWTMTGPSPYISKLFGLVFNMDQMIGKDFETGLANLKTAAETAKE